MATNNVLIIICANSVLHLIICFAQEPLFTASDPIYSLTHENYDNFVFRKDTGSLVDMYLSSCGACRNFAPTYVQIGHVVKNWYKVVNIGAIDCVDQLNNRHVCQAMQITGFPTLVYFRPNSSLYTDSVVMTTNKQLQPVLNALVNQLINDYQINRYSTWPNFDYLNKIKSFNDIWIGVPEKYTHSFLIIDDGRTVVGAEAMLNYSSCNDWLYIRRGKAESVAHLNWNNATLPKAYFLERAQSKPIFELSLNSLTPENIWKHSGNNNKLETCMIFPSQKDKAIPKRPLTDEERKDMYVVTENDLLVSLHQMLFQIGNQLGNADIKGESLTALKEFVNILKIYLDQTDAMKNTMERLQYSASNVQYRFNRVKQFLENFSRIMDTLSINGNSVKDIFYFNETLETFFGTSHVPNLTHCIGSSDRYRGHTCGVWQIFHMLTVNFYFIEYDSIVDSRYVLRGIAKFVEHFLYCTECQDHFHQTITSSELNMEQQVKTKSDGVLYLWKVHNKVNHRLSGTASDDPWFPKSQFPPNLLCVDCKDSTSNEWNENNVLKFLLKYYTKILPYTSQPSNANGKSINAFLICFMFCSIFMIL